MEKPYTRSEINTFMGELHRKLDDISMGVKEIQGSLPAHDKRISEIEWSQKRNANEKKWIWAVIVVMLPSLYFIGKLIIKDIVHQVAEEYYIDK